jgi:hypothetical protein
MFGPSASHSFKAMLAVPSETPRDGRRSRRKPPFAHLDHYHGDDGVIGKGEPRC